MSNDWSIEDTIQMAGNLPGTRIAVPGAWTIDNLFETDGQTSVKRAMNGAIREVHAYLNGLVRRTRRLVRGRRITKQTIMNNTRVQFSLQVNGEATRKTNWVHLDEVVPALRFTFSATGSYGGFKETSETTLHMFQPGGEETLISEEDPSIAHYLDRMRREPLEAEPQDQPPEDLAPYGGLPAGWIPGAGAGAGAPGYGGAPIPADGAEILGAGVEVNPQYLRERRRHDEDEKLNLNEAVLAALDDDDDYDEELGAYLEARGSARDDGSFNGDVYVLGITIVFASRATFEAEANPRFRNLSSSNDNEDFDIDVPEVDYEDAVDDGIAEVGSGHNRRYFRLRQTLRTEDILTNTETLQRRARMLRRLDALTPQQSAALAGRRPFTRSTATGLLDDIPSSRTRYRRSRRDGVNRRRNARPRGLREQHFESVNSNLHLQAQRVDVEHPTVTIREVNANNVFIDNTTNDSTKAAITPSEVKSSRSIIAIEDDPEGLCLYVALIVSLSYKTHKAEPTNKSAKSQFHRLNKAPKHAKYRVEDAKKLIAKYKLPASPTFDDLSYIEDSLKINIVIHSMKDLTVLYRNANVTTDATTHYLLATDAAHHIGGVITNIDALTVHVSKDTTREMKTQIDFYTKEGKKRTNKQLTDIGVSTSKRAKKRRRRSKQEFGYCRGCNTWHTSAFHNCLVACSHVQCGLAHVGANPPPGVNTIHCLECYRTLPEPCYKAHKASAHCDRTWWCESCGFALNRRTNSIQHHVCGRKFCALCYSLHEPAQSCMLQPLKSKPFGEVQVLYLDFETSLDDTVEDKKHIVTHVGIVPDYNDDYQAFNSLDEVMKHITLHYQNHTVFAHNMAGYDGHFIYNWLLENRRQVGNIIRDGMRLVQFKDKQTGIMFRDSLRQLPMPLAKFVKAFNLPKSFAKGHFPYTFYCKSNLDYRGAFPAVSFYLDDQRQTSSQQKSIRAWHQQELEQRKALVLCGKRQHEFDMREEVFDYCKQDVMLLKAGLSSFRHLFHKLTLVDPLREVTLSSAVMAAYRTTFMPLGQIAVLSYEVQTFLRRGYYGGYTECFKPIVRGDMEKFCYADACSMYPTQMMFELYPYGRGMMRGRNWFDEQGLERTIQAVLDGSLFGFLEVDMDCPTDLYIPVLPRKGEKLEFSLDPIRQQVYTTPEIKFALEHGYKLRFVHRGYTWLGTTNGLFRKYVGTFFWLKTLCGGLPHHLQNEERGSEHITTCVVDKFMALKLRKDSSSDAEALASLMTCTEERFNELNNLHHFSDYAKVRAAVKEHWSSALWQYHDLDRLTPSVDFITQSIFAISYPDAAYKTLSKLLLNTLYGKFGQRVEFPKIDLIHDRVSFWSLINSPVAEVTNVTIHHEAGQGLDSRVGVVEVRSKPNGRHERLKTLKSFAAVSIAAFTTAYARLNLLRQIYKVGAERIMYCDTDSVFFRLLPGDQPDDFVEGDGLGAWELEHPVGTPQPIQEFVSTGPKVYGYKLDNGKCVMHMKGFTATHSTNDLFRPASLYEALTAPEPDEKRLVNLPAGEEERRDRRVQIKERFEATRGGEVRSKATTRTYYACFSKRDISKVDVCEKSKEVTFVDTMPHGSSNCHHTKAQPMSQFEMRYPIHNFLKK